MKNNRNRNSMNKAEKLARKTLVRELIIFSLIIIFVILLMFFLVAVDLKMNFFDLLYQLLPALPIPCVAFLLSIVFVWFIEKPSHINHAYERVSKDYSKKLAENLLPPGDVVQIVLRNTRMNVYEEFFKNLGDIVEFYAVLGEQDNLISIYVRFNEDGKDRLLDVISKEEFATYCEII